jgi:hypothetical protein
LSNKFIAYYTNSIFKKDLAAKAEIMPVFSNMLANMPGIKHVLLLISHYAISLVSRGVQDPADIGTCANGLPPRVQDPFWVRMRKVLSNDFFNTNLWCQDCLVKNLITLVDFDSLLVLVDSKWKAIWHSLLSQYYEWLSQYQVLKILRNYNIISWSSFIVTLTIVCIWYASVAYLNTSVLYRIWRGRAHRILHFVCTWWQLSIFVLLLLLYPGFRNPR